ncbi:Genetic suppressor element 1 [Camelus dromedarius]|uniref:Genetic suppressor element 1 n=1 Tax=Camelus dromedarius TaxID=9838 RepID=A0A5N4CQ88_CAMDR|nr:Genetic suppressor element 1 [Camelus dromedarius]KAB1261106.1 Genetic suppressor element 1 [Camelus dromedarius]
MSMNCSPNFEEKRKFLDIFNLTHISAEKRERNRSVLSAEQNHKVETSSRTWSGRCADAVQAVEAQHYSLSRSAEQLSTRAAIIFNLKKKAYYQH